MSLLNWKALLLGKPLSSQLSARGFRLSLSAQLEGSAAWKGSKKGRPGPPPFLICAKSVTNEAFLVKIHIRNCPGFKICLWKLPTGPAQLGGSPAAQLGGSPAAQLGKPRSTGARRSTGKKPPPPGPSTAASQPAQPSPASQPGFYLLLPTYQVWSVLLGTLTTNHWVHLLFYLLPLPTKWSILLGTSSMPPMKCASWPPGGEAEGHFWDSANPGGILGTNPSNYLNLHVRPETAQLVKPHPLNWEATRSTGKTAPPQLGSHPLNWKAPPLNWEATRSTGKPPLNWEAHRSLRSTGKPTAQAAQLSGPVEGGASQLRGASQLSGAYQLRDANTCGPGWTTRRFGRK